MSGPRHGTWSSTAPIHRRDHLLSAPCPQVYPGSRRDALTLLGLITPIRDTDAREDLQTLARMYCSALEMQLRDKSR